MQFILLGFLLKISFPLRRIVTEMRIIDMTWSLGEGIMEIN